MRLATALAVPVLLAAELPEDRALTYLAREVPRWAAENRCYSCHNNGDGARALFRAARLGRRVERGAIEDSARWLATPAGWDSNRGDPAISDKRLARIQFAAALAEAVEAGAAPKTALQTAARLVAREQDPDGGWRTDGSEAGLGSPVTWGVALATYMSMRVADRGGERDSARKAAQWFERFEPKSHMDTAVAILALDRTPRRDALVDKLRIGQNPDGGWGPYRATPSEVFDTALALLAMARVELHGETKRGREYLVRTQLVEGGWPETTRPAGGRSYAQHISTTAWAMLALIETN